MLPDLSRHLEEQTSEREVLRNLRLKNLDANNRGQIFSIAGMFENWRARCEHHFGFAKVLLCAWAVVETTEKSWKK